MTARHVPRILVVDDEPKIRSAIGEILSDEGYSVALASGATQARREYAASRPDLVLLDVWMEGDDGISVLKGWAKATANLPPVVMMSGHGTVDTAIEATRLGALDFIEKPVSLSKLLHMVERALKTSPRRREPLGAAPLLDAAASHPAIEQLKESLGTALGHPEPVLFVGESGSGRKTLAHRLARDGNRAFVSLSLLGARAKDVHEHIDNLREQALIYLEDLDSASDAVQEVLSALIARGHDTRLRFAASAQPVQESHEVPHDLQRELYDRLAVFRVEVPPLREYREYLPEVIRYCVDELADREGYTFRRFDVAALNRLRRHDWPGNLRELNNVLKRILASDKSGTVELEEADAALATPNATPPRLGEDMLSLPYREARERFERAYLEAQLELAGGKVAALAERVGLERTHLYRKLKTLGINLSDERGSRAD